MVLPALFIFDLTMVHKSLKEKRMTFILNRALDGVDLLWSCLSGGLTGLDVLKFIRSTGTEKVMSAS